MVKSILLDLTPSVRSNINFYHYSRAVIDSRLHLNIKNLDHLGLVAGLCQEIGIAEIIDKLISSTANDKIMSTGKCLEAMILNGLGCTGRTLNMYSQYFEDKPIQRLLGNDIKAEQINDDALDRCLDKLFEHGDSHIYQI